MSRYRALLCLSFTALFLMLTASHGSVAPAASQEEFMRIKIGNNRGLQTACTAEEGFTVSSESFPEMEGCFEAQEVIPTGRPGLAVMRYESEAALFYVEFDPFFGFRWYASYYIGELDNYGVGESSVTVCRTNEDIGIDIQPADGTLTYECDLDGDGVRETSPATAAVLSFSCGCDGEASSPPAPTTPTPSATPDSIDSTEPPVAAPPTTTTIAPSPAPTTPTPSVTPGSINGTDPPAGAPSTTTIAPSPASIAPSPSARPDSIDGTSPPAATTPAETSAPSGATGAPSASGNFLPSVAPTNAARTAAPTAAPTGSPTSVIVATMAPVLLDEAASGSTSTSGSSSVYACGGLTTLAAMIGGVLAVVTGARR